MVVGLSAAQPRTGFGARVGHTTGHRRRWLYSTTMLSRPSRWMLAGMLAGALSMPATVGALPEGGTVVAGSAEIVQTAPDRLDIFQQTERAVIDWNSFNIGADEHVNFEQPSTVADVLNRVLGSGATEILGRLTATGRVFLSNADGVRFGATARVDVGSLVATTIDILDRDFMAGNFEFGHADDAASRDINEGLITVARGGIAALVAPWVENSGVIQARLGRVALVSGETFTLDLYATSWCCWPSTVPWPTA